MTVENKVVIEKPVEINNDLEKIDQSKLNALKEMLKAKAEEKLPPVIVEKKRKALNFGVVGSGQAGSRVAEQFYNLGYPTVAFNTASQDLENIALPEANKFLLEFTIGGAAKDLGIGYDAAETHKNEIANLIFDKLNDSDVLIFASSLGGGSGAGSTDVMLNVLNSTGKPVIVVAILPMSSDDAQTKQNSLETLAKVAQRVQAKEVSNLIVVDNTKLETIYSRVSHLDFFKVCNKAIVDLLDKCNHLSTQSSPEKAIDDMEFAKILTNGEGLSVYGEVSVPDWQEDETAIARAIVNNFDNGLLASGFDIAQARYGGVFLVANEEVWKQISRVSVDYAMALIREKASGHETILHGSYVDNEVKDNSVHIYSIFSGLGLPASRIDQLKKDVNDDAERAKVRVVQRDLNLTLDTGKDKTVSKADEVRKKLELNNSKFTKNFTLGAKKDLRK